MTELRAIRIDDKKFMWDGTEYENLEEAKTKEASYAKDGFETQIVEEDGKVHVYTRRVVTEIDVEGV